MPDHLDGSCNRTEMRDGSVRYFNTKLPLRKPTGMKKEDLGMYQKMVNQREVEVTEVINDFLRPEFMKKTLQLGKGAKISTEHITVAGHSMGGATALKVGESDPRVKIILTHDPTKDFLNPGITDFKKIYNKMLFVLNSMQYRLDNSNTFDYFTKKFGKHNKKY